jgi:hypothetical protein
MKVRFIELDPPAYFSLNEESIEGLRLQSEIAVCWVPIGSDYCFCSMLAPHDFSWGLPYRNDELDTEFADQISESAEFASNLRRAIQSAGLRPDGVSDSLTVVNRFFRGRLVVGRRAGQLDPKKLRSHCVRFSDAALAEFGSRYLEYAEQLGLFFLLPSAGTDSAYDVESSTNSHLLAAFGIVHSGRSASAPFLSQQRTTLLSYIGSVDSGDSIKWLRPKTLIEDDIRIRHPLPRFSGATDVSSLNSESELPNSYAISLYQTRLLRKWCWPIGAHVLHRQHTDIVYRASALSGTKSWPELDNEVQLLLEAVKARYPILLPTSPI